MAASQHGTAYLHGIPETAIAQSVILSLRYTKQRENVAVTEDQNGNRVARRADDTTTALEMTCRITGTFSEPALDSKVTIAASENAGDNGDYFVAGVSRSKQAKGHTELTLSLERWEYLNLGA
jgi:hypothetical protein